MSTLKDQAQATAQSAIRACHEYVIGHNGKRSPILDETYTAAERIVDAVEEYERLEAIAHDGAEDAWEATLATGQYQSAPVAEYHPDFVALVAYLEDPGDHYAGMAS